MKPIHIALVFGSTRPVPATLGGATQTMLTNLIDENEKIGNFIFHVFSYYEKSAVDASRRYQKTSFYYYVPSALDKLYSLFFRVLRKLSNHRIYIRSRFIKWCSTKMPSTLDYIIIEGNYFQVEQMKSLSVTPLILHIHIDALYKGVERSKEISNACQAIITISNYCANRVESIQPCNKGKVYVLKNCIDTKHFSPSKTQTIRNAVRSELGISKKAFTFIFCGRLCDDKGIKELLEAISEIKDEKSALIVVGSNAYKDGKKDSFVKGLEKLAKNSHVPIVFTGYIDQEKLPEYYAAADVAVIPSKCNEAAGNVTIEALSCGLPVICSSQGGIPEYADKRASIHVKADDNFKNSLRIALETIRDNDKMYYNMRNEARLVALKHDKCNYYKDFSDIIKSIDKL